MTYDTDPPRLRLSADPEDSFLRALEDARLELPDSKDLKPLAERLGLASGGWPRGYYSIARTRLRTKSIQAGAVALAVACGVGATVLIRNGFPFRKAPPMTVAPKESAPSPAPVQAVRPAPRRAAPARPVAPAPAEVPTPERSRSRTRVILPHAATDGNATNEPSHGDLPTSDLDEAVGPEAEARLLGRAQRTLSASPSRALALTEQHRREYPTGALTQESDVIAIEALVALGRIDQARAAAASFRARYPRSAHLRRIDRLLGETQPAIAPGDQQTLPAQ